MIEIELQRDATVDLMKCSQEALDSFGSLEAVKVNGDLNLHRCTGLTKLPEGLMVNKDLFLNYCTGITKLPEDLNVYGDIWYNYCTGFCGHEDEPGVIPESLKHNLYKFS
jgi:hypothetical protein